MNTHEHKSDMILFAMIVRAIWLWLKHRRSGFPRKIELTMLLLAPCSVTPESASGAAQQETHWERVANLDTPQQYHACVVVDGRIYTVGGYRDAAFEEYEVKSNVWRVLPAIPTPRAFPAAAAVNRRIYAIGRLDKSNQTLASVECFDLDAKHWQRCADLPTPRNRLAAVALAGKILVLGGMDQNGNSSAVEEFDPESKHWTGSAWAQCPTLLESLRHRSHGRAYLYCRWRTTAGPRIAAQRLAL